MKAILYWGLNYVLGTMQLTLTHVLFDFMIKQSHGGNHHLQMKKLRCSNVKNLLEIIRLISGRVRPQIPLSNSEDYTVTPVPIDSHAQKEGPFNF